MNPLRPSWISSLPQLRVLVVGDVMLDQFVFGHVERISPEAPVPVILVDREESRLGGAANVAANLADLGTRVSLCGVLGPGEAGDALLLALGERGIDTEHLVRCVHRVTTVKTRMLGGGQQIVRIDRETRGALVEATRQRLDAAFAASEADVVVISDYGKGVVSESLMAVAREQRALGRPVVVDPKQADFRLYRGTTCITPNAREAGGAVHDRVEDDVSALRVGRALRERLGTDMILLTRGEQGMTLIAGGDAPTHIPTVASRVFDVTGAGDTVLATFAAGLGAGASPEEAAQVANVAAGCVVREIGTATVTPEKLLRALEDLDRG